MGDAHLTLLPLSAQPVVPWRNGGGSTREVARAPAEGDATGFRWRVSIARVGADGPFSVFPGVDRTLWLLAGAGMELSIDGVPSRLDAPLASVQFAGEATVTARLLAGPTDDLNVMVARSSTRATTAVLPLARTQAHTHHADHPGTDLLLALTGEVAIHSPTGSQVRLQPGDALRLDHATAPRRWTLRAITDPDPVVLVATFARYPAARS